MKYRIIAAGDNLKKKEEEESGYGRIQLSNTSDTIIEYLDNRKEQDGV